MAASKDSIDNLIRNTRTVNQEWYSAIFVDASVYDRCKDNIPPLLKDVLELRMDVKFILVDLFTIMQACLATDRFYEKRYHLKNLYAGMLESYKLLYGFAKMRKRTIWTRIGNDIKQTIDDYPKSKEAFKLLNDRYESITKSLQEIEATKGEQDDRNLTYHYDDDLLLVYRLTLKMDSEDAAVKKYSNFMKILGEMLELSNLIETIYLLLGCKLPKGNGQNNELSLKVVENVAKTFAEHPYIQGVLLKAVDNGAKQLDVYARNKQGILKIEDYIGENLRLDVPFPEFQIIKNLLDVQLMVSFMLSDAATIMRSFINAGSRVEYPLTLRRLTISRVSTLKHLIGYKKDDSDSMWSRIIAIIPDGKDELKEKAQTIRTELKLMRRIGDCDTRALYVHFIDNHKYFSNVPLIIKAMENLEILTELQVFHEVIKTCGKVSQFITELLDVLSTDAREARLESECQLKEQFNIIRKMADYPNCPDLLKGSLRNQVDELEKMMKKVKI